MNIKDGWVASTYSNHDGKIGIEISRERVRQIEKNAMKKVKQSIASGL